LKQPAKKRIIKESLDYNAILEKSHTQPVYIHIADSSKESKEDAAAVDVAAKLSGFAIHINLPAELAKYHAGQPVPEFEMITKLIGTHRITVGEVYILSPTMTGFIRMRSSAESRVYGPNDDDDAVDGIQYVGPAYFPDTDSGSPAGQAKRRGAILHAIATSPKGTNLTYGEFLQSQHVARPEHVDDTVSPDAISEHLKRAELARKQGDYIKESIYRKLAKELLAERSDADIYGVDPNESVILSKWFSSRLKPGQTKAFQLMQTFEYFILDSRYSKEFVRQWDREYGNSTNPLAEFLVAAKAYFKIVG